jgi:hypothetical protein
VLRSPRIIVILLFGTLSSIFWKCSLLSFGAWALIRDILVYLPFILN